MAEAAADAAADATKAAEEAAETAASHDAAEEPKWAAEGKRRKIASCAWSVDMHVELDKAHLISATDLEDWHVRVANLVVQWTRQLRADPATKKITEHKAHEGHVTCCVGPQWTTSRLDQNAQ